MQGQQAAQRFGRGGVQPGVPGGGAQLVLAAVAQQRQQPRPRRGGHIQRVQQAGQVAHVAQLQHRAALQRRQAARGQPHDLGLLGRADSAQRFQAHLAELFKRVARAAGAADLFDVIILLALPGRGLGVFGNGQRHVGADGPQPAVQVGEGDDLCGGQKVLVLLVQRILLKPRAAEPAVARLLVQSAQPQRTALCGRADVPVKLHNIPLYHSQNIMWIKDVGRATGGAKKQAYQRALRRTAQRQKWYACF